MTISTFNDWLFHFFLAYGVCVITAILLLSYCEEEVEERHGTSCLENNCAQNTEKGDHKGEPCTPTQHKLVVRTCMEVLRLC